MGVLEGEPKRFGDGGQHSQGRPNLPLKEKKKKKAPPLEETVKAPEGLEEQSKEATRPVVDRCCCR